MSSLDADPWGSWNYDRTPANEVLEPDNLVDFLNEAKDFGELSRQAHISLELATHPNLPYDQRLEFVPTAVESYDLLAKSGQADLTTLFIHAFLPLMLPFTTKSERRNAASIVRAQTLSFAELLIDTFNETDDDGTKRDAIGHAAEALSTITARQLGYDARPSLYRQDRAIPYVDGRRFSWDVTVAPHSNEIGRTTLLQIKHRDFDDGKVGYHEKITVYRVFRPEERMNLVAPKVFDLLRTALQINGLHDHGRFKKHTLDLARTLRQSGKAAQHSA